jgi:hypothetical protein
MRENTRGYRRKTVNLHVELVSDGHCSFLGKARHCDYQPWTTPRWKCECMSVYVSRSKTNIVVCELENVCSEGFESFGFAMSQPPPTVQYLLSQLDQMGYGLYRNQNKWDMDFHRVECLGPCNAVLVHRFTSLPNIKPVQSIYIVYS